MGGVGPGKQLKPYSLVSEIRLKPGSLSLCSSNSRDRRAALTGPTLRSGEQSGPSRPQGVLQCASSSSPSSSWLPWLPFRRSRARSLQQPVACMPAPAAFQAAKHSSLPLAKRRGPGPSFIFATEAVFRNSRHLAHLSSSSCRHARESGHPGQPAWSRRTGFRLSRECRKKASAWIHNMRSP